MTMRGSGSQDDTGRPTRGRTSGGGTERDGRVAELELFERLEQPVLAILPYLMLVVSLLATALVPSSRPALPLALILSATVVVWTLWVFALHPTWHNRRGIMAVFLVILLVLAGVLVSIDPWFGFFAFSCYFYSFWAATGRWRAAAVCVVAILIATSQAGGLPGIGTEPVPTWFLLCIVNIVVSAGFFWFATRSDAQSERRKGLVIELSEANRKLEETLRENAGLQAQLVAQAREAGVVDERQRMAREIHDTLAQGLAGIITQLQAAERAGQAGPESERQRHLTAAIELARESLAEARRSVLALPPEALQPGHVTDALSDVARRWTGLNRVEAQFTVTGTARPLAPETELVLLRVAQEALANVAKHARAGRVGLTLSYMEDLVTLDIRDDGIGFTAEGDAAGASPAAAEQPAWSSRSGGTAGPDAQLAGGFGLMAMRERVEGIGGTVEIESEPDSGTAISASLPVGCNRAGSEVATEVPVSGAA
jgi:signal transduction histidine kinase